MKNMSPVSLKLSSILILVSLSVFYPFTGIAQSDSPALTREESNDVAQQSSEEPARVRLFNWILTVLRV